ncbi:MAG TPA: phosphatase PAP2 family protein, partial [Nocardioides sp.]|uniref:phosphatase PAP2 family protein n=1 Tax=Nocardioides sp. TaxID=35761 RepID=UPI002C02C8E6
PAGAPLPRRLAPAPPGAAAPRAARLLRGLGRFDRAGYAAVARVSTPALDAPLRRLSGFANHSKPWFLTAGVLAAAGGPAGRRAAVTGVAAIGLASLVVNQPMKLLGRRRRPERDRHGVPEPRWVPMPTSTSFPSGHSASAAAFAVAVGDVVPQLRVPLGAAAATVAFSRVYTGVHYPGDVLVGAATGALLGRLVSRLGDRLTTR